MIKFITLLVILLVTAQCTDIFEENGFYLPGHYNISNDCNINQCPNTPDSSGTEFICPYPGQRMAHIAYGSGGIYYLDLRTSSLGQFSEQFTEQNISRNSQVKISLQNGYTLNMLPCLNGQYTSYLCPKDPYYNTRVMVAWKSYHGEPIKDCYFLMMRQ